MMARRLRVCALLLAAVSVAGCGDDKQDSVQLPGAGYNQQGQPYVAQSEPFQQPQTASNGQPVIINNQPASSGGGIDPLAAGMLGYMMGSSGNNSSRSVETRTVYRDRPVYRQPVTPPPAASKPVYSGYTKAAAPAAPAPQPAAKKSYSGWGSSSSSSSSSSKSSSKSYSGFSKKR